MTQAPRDPSIKPAVPHLVADDAPAIPHPTAVFAVTSGKGGVGKTVISANLALSLARQGRRVLLIDADLSLANLDLVLGVDARRTVRDALSGKTALAEVIVRGPLGVALLPACSGDERLAELPPQQRLEIFSAIEGLEQHYDTVVVDTGAGIGSNATGFAAAAQHVLVVVTPDPASMADAYAMIKVLGRRGIRRVHLVANMVNTAQEAENVVGRLLELVDRFLDVAVVPIGTIYRDDTVGRSVRAMRPLVISYPEAPSAKTIHGIAGRLLCEPPVLDHGRPLLFWKRMIGVDEISSA